MRFLSQHYPINSVVVNPNTQERFFVVKEYKRLFLKDSEKGTLRYTPPDHVRLPSRAPLQELARLSNEKGGIDIEDIIELEREYRK